MNERLLVKLSGIVLACSVIAGCATPAKDVASTPEVFNKQLADADAAAKSGDQARAITLYQQLAKSNPTREEPWSRIAQLQFKQAHYGQAIVAAREALQRGQADRQAKRVLALSSLRIATQSLNELRLYVSLAAEATPDAQALAAQLRDALGEAALLPQPDPGATPVVKKRRVSHHVVK